MPRRPWNRCCRVTAWATLRCLVRCGASAYRHARTEVTICRCGRIARPADASSVHLLLSLLLRKDGEATGTGHSFADHARTAQAEPGSARHRRDIAYWKEVLHNAPAIAPIPGRRRAAAPAGMGSNRGKVGILEATLVAKDAFAALSGTLDAALLAAYAKALAGRFCVDAIILDRQFSERGDGAPDGLIGPLDGSYPIVLRTSDQARPDLLRQIERADTNGRAHRLMDTASLELAFEEDLRLRHIALRQFGFAFVEQDQTGQGASLGLDAVSVSTHEIQLGVAVRDAGILIRLSVDLANC